MGLNARKVDRVVEVAVEEERGRKEKGGERGKVEGKCSLKERERDAKEKREHKMFDR